MQPLKNYEQTEAYTEFQRLPAGGYVLKILHVEITEPYSGDHCRRMLISFDIAEGDHADFYKQQYVGQTGEDKKWKGVYRLTIPNDDGSEDDGKRYRRFKTFMNLIEDCNAGYHWAWMEETLRGKLFGGLFNNKEYDYQGRHGFFTNLARTTTVEKIRSGEFELPEDQYLKTQQADINGFVNLPDNIDEELPFK